MFADTMKMLFGIFRVILGLLLLSGCGGVGSASSSKINEIGWNNSTDVNAININNYQLSGTCAPDGGDVTIDVGNPILASLLTSCVNGFFSTTIDLSGLGLVDGSLQLLALQNDISTSSVLDIIIDTQVPSAPNIISPTDSSYSRLQNIIVDGSCETNAIVRLTGNINGSQNSVTCASGAFTLNITLSGNIGLKNITAVQTDPSGNISLTDSVSINYDNIAPLNPTISSPLSNLNTNSVSQVLSGSCETDAMVTLSGSFTSSPVVFVCSTGSYTQSINLVPGDGLKSFSLFQQDLAGNTSGTTSRSMTLDQTLPSAPTIISPLNNLNTNATAQTLSGACETDATVSITGDIIGSPVSWVCLGNSYSQFINLTTGNGAKALSIRQTDLANNLSATTTININLDQSAPLAPTIISPADNLNTNVTAQTINGSCETGATLNFSGDILGSPINLVCSGGVYTQAITLTTGDGAKALSVTQTDLADNLSPEAIININLDQIDPIAPGVNSPTTGSYVNSVNQNIIGTCEINSQISITGNIVGGPSLGTCDMTGNYDIAVVLTTGDEVKAIGVRQTDLAGNQSSLTQLSLNLDTIAPGAPIVFNPMTNSSTNTQSKTFNGICEAGASVSISGDLSAGPLSAPCVSGAFSVTASLTSGDGLKVINVLQTDIAGNVSANVVLNINLDTVTPTDITVTNPVEGAYRNSQLVSVNGTCENLAVVSITGDFVGSPVIFSCSGPNLFVNINVTLGDGPKALNIIQTDAAGNSSSPVTRTINFDQTPSVAPSIASPVNNLNTNTVSQTIIGNCVTNDTVEVSGDFTGSPITSTCLASSYSQAINLSSPDGAKLVSVLQTDLAGNDSTSSSITLNLDRMAPLAPAITSPASGLITNQVSQTIIGTCENGSSISLTGDINLAPVSASCLAGNYMANINLISGDAAKSISAVQTDAAGNSSLASIIILNLDQTPPSGLTIASPADNLDTNQTSQIITGACETAATVNISGAIVGGPLTVLCSSSTYSQMVNLNPGDGVKAISITQTDPANNVSVPVDITLNLDQTPPLAPTITSPTDDLNTNQDSQTIIGNCETSATVNISGAIVGSPVSFVCGASSYSQEITLTSGDGVKPVSVSQTDSASNASSVSSININLDQTSPSVPSISAPTDGLITNQTAQTITGSCETNATVNIISSAMTGSPYSVVCMSSSYSIDVTLTATQELKSYLVNQTDSVGNISGDISASIILDTTNPLAPVVASPSDVAFVNTTAQTISGNCEANIDVEISGDIVGSSVGLICSSEGSFSQSIVLVTGDGAKSLNLTQTDQANNTSAPATLTLTLDTVDPVVTISSGESSPSTSNPIVFSVSFNESIQTFDPSDLTISNGSLESSSGGPLVYTISVTPSSVGNVSLQLPSNQVQDLAGNNNLASNTTTIDYQPIPANAFVTTWSIPSDSTTVTLPLESGFIYNFTIDWGDGSPVNTVTAYNDSDASHTFALSGTYTVVMIGSMEAYGSPILPNPCYITTVDQVGYMGWLDMQYMFKDCTLLTSVTSNGDEFASVSRMDAMFMGATSTNPDTSTWVTTSLTHAPEMFSGAISANPDTSSWNLALITDLTDVFNGSNINNLNYTNFLIMADTTSAQINIPVGTVPAQYQPAGDSARTSLITTKTWSITDSGAE